jgi:hypothetical protein
VIRRQRNCREIFRDTDSGTLKRRSGIQELACEFWSDAILRNFNREAVSVEELAFW